MGLLCGRVSADLREVGDKPSEFCEQSIPGHGGAVGRPCGGRGRENIGVKRRCGGEVQGSVRKEVREPVGPGPLGPEWAVKVGQGSPGLRGGHGAPSGCCGRGRGLRGRCRVWVGGVAAAGSSSGDGD